MSLKDSPAAHFGDVPLFQETREYFAKQGRIPALLIDILHRTDTFIKQTKTTIFKDNIPLMRAVASEGLRVLLKPNNLTQESIQEYNTRLTDAFMRGERKNINRGKESQIIR